MIDQKIIAVSFQNFIFSMLYITANPEAGEYSGCCQRLTAGINQFKGQDLFLQVMQNSKSVNSFEDMNPTG